MLTKENIQRKNKPLRKIVKAIGCGGVSLIAMATGLSRTTITDTIKETSKLKRMELQNNSKTNIICSGYLWTITKHFLSQCLGMLILSFSAQETHNLVAYNQ